MKQVEKHMLISDVLRVDRGIETILFNSGMHCLGCPSSQMESLEDACMVHGLNSDAILSQINQYLSTLEETFIIK